MHRDGLVRTPIGPEQDESAAGVGRDGHDGAHANFVVRELVLTPVEALVSREQNVVRRLLVIGP